MNQIINSKYFGIFINKNVHLLQNKIQKKYSGIVFCDRDGVIIEETNYISDPSEVAIIDGVNTFLGNAKRQNYGICIITNQSGINRGYFSWSDYFAVTERMLEKLNVDLLPDIIVACSCTPNEFESASFQFRKPNTEMINLCYQKLKISINQNSLLIGDKLSDIICGIKSNISYNYHVLTGHGASERDKIKSIAKKHANVRMINSIQEINL